MTNFKPIIFENHLLTVDGDDWKVVGVGAAASAVVTNLADHRAARDQSIGMTAADIGE